MPLELFATESAYYLFAQRPGEPDDSLLENSVGYLEVVLTTATISLLLFLVEVARKFGLMARIAMIYNKSRDGDYSFRISRCKVEDCSEITCRGCNSSSSSVSSATIPVGTPCTATISTIANTFSSALPNRKLVEMVRSSLETFGFGKNTMLCTSLCCDELNRPLEYDLSDAFGNSFNIGGKKMLIHVLV